MIIYTRRPISSVQELLPDYNYLYDVEKSNALRESYPNNYPRNEFLEKLNNSDKTQLLKNTEFTEIIGKTNNENKVQCRAIMLMANDDKKYMETWLPKIFRLTCFE